MAKHKIKVKGDAAAFMVSLYHILNVDGPAEKALSDFTDAVLDEGGPAKEYEFWANGVKLSAFDITWRMAE